MDREARAQVEGEMSLIRKYPFGDEDPVEVMVEEVAAEASRQGSSLTVEERALLASERPKKSSISTEADNRMAQFITAIIAREAEDQEINADYRKRSFSNAIEWAGDMQYPYVVELAEKAIFAYQAAHPQLRRRRIVRDTFSVFFAAVLLIVVFSVVGVLISKLAGIISR
ncbi:MAG: hypothetical protein JWN45_2951 [Acidobacteriaceae bacterium]|nr:hypothetical protein [Acidobacteriaceae bacterium]